MTPRLQRAIDFMKAAHRSIDQRRKDNVRLYEVHPLDVFERLLMAGVTDEDVLIAGLLHDVEEDVAAHKPLEFSLGHIARAFGQRVAGFVFELSDEYTKANYPEKNRRERKQLERKRYATFSPEAKLVKLADIASNLNDDGQVLEADGLPEVGFNRMFIKEKALCLPYLVSIACPENLRDSHAALWQSANEILEAQKKKFDVR